jgi:peptidyl-tRNA hydrolase, PTH1 family
VRLLIGLGNPGAAYERTRHNVGWRVLDSLARKWNAVPAPQAMSYRGARGALGERQVELMWPLTYMNLSGDALLEWRARNELDADGLLVISDDVYLPVGALRIRSRGSSGGHRGLESLEAALGSQEFARLRIGVGRASGAELREHVLECFEEDEEAIVTGIVAQAAEAAECWVLEGVTAAMNRFNRRAGQEADEP